MDFGRSRAQLGFIAYILIIVAVGFLAGQATERHYWENTNMGNLCERDHYWACRLHPACAMYSLICIANLDFKDAPTHPPSAGGET